jgi:hypothetical protein
MIERNISPPRHSLNKLETHLEGINKGKMIDTPFYSIASALVANNNNLSSPTQSQMEQISYFENPREDS